MTVSVVKKIRDGQGLDALFDEVTWWVILAGLGVMVCGMACRPRRRSWPQRGRSS